MFICYILAIKICIAVISANFKADAHQNKVIHCDIKPPNILIQKDGTPKLLDFGIAKVLKPELGVDTIDPTATAMRLMTPEYASPEQVCGGKITPASDIYSMGVLLYELLTGHRPYRFANRAAHEIARVICEEEPLRPSTGVTRKDNLLPTGASEATTLRQIYLFRGASNIEDLQKELSGDIERIYSKVFAQGTGRTVSKCRRVCRRHHPLSRRKTGRCRNAFSEFRSNCRCFDDRRNIACCSAA